MGTTRVSVPSKLGFLDLPPELRLKVYRSLFVADKFRFHMEATLYKFERQGTEDELIQIPSWKNVDSQFLRTCKLILHEGLPVLYEENVFAFTSVYALDNWTQHRWFSHKHLIKTVFLECMSNNHLRGLEPMIPSLTSMANLRRFDIHLPIYHSGAYLNPNISLKVDVLLGLKQIIDRDTRCKGFLKKLFGHNPSIESGVIVEIAKASLVPDEIVGSLFLHSEIERETDSALERLRLERCRR